MYPDNIYIFIEPESVNTETTQPKLLMAPGSLIDCSSSLRNFSAVQGLEPQESCWNVTLIYSFSFPSSEAWSLHVFERSCFLGLFDQLFLKWQNCNKYFIDSSLKSDFRWFSGIYCPEYMRKWSKCFGTDPSQIPAAIPEFVTGTFSSKIHWEPGTPFMSMGKVVRTG